MSLEQMSQENVPQPDSADKAEIVKKFGKSENDTGSAEVQVALLTKRIERLTQHFGSHRGDIHSRRGMMKLISQRKRLLQYMRHKNVERYRNTIAALGLRK